MKQPTALNAVWYTAAGAMIGAAASVVLSIVPDDGAETETIAEAAMPAEPVIDLDTVVLVRPVTQMFTVKAGETLSDLLARAGLDRSHAFDLVEALTKVFNPRHLRAGQSLALTFALQPSDVEPRRIDALEFELDAGRAIAVNLDAEGAFVARAIEAETQREHARYDGVISTSLFAAAEKQGVPLDVLNEMVRLFSYDVDFQREIQNGDRFSVMFERVVTAEGRPIRNGRIRHASMTLSGVEIKLYAFTHADGFVDYYNEKGEGARKALMRTPINGARLTSGFGVRRHPILGFSKMHRGIDFGAPTGTPIFAAGDGMVEVRGPNGAYGNYIRIRHYGGFSTAYAHLSRYAKDVAAGKRVRQGQVIGYVGSSGRSTGPHLHFEILKNAAQVNPITVKFPASQKLDGALMAQFKTIRETTDREYAALAPPTKMAAIEATPSAVRSD
jgi:murein DD-endopeptidase MepM/ murein hydrolase activator NlpD